MHVLSTQLIQVVRRLRRTPLFSVVTLLIIGIGTAANIIVFSLVEGVLLKPLPYPHSEQLVSVDHHAPAVGDLNIAPSNYFVYRDLSKTLEDVGLYQGSSVGLTGMGTPETVSSLGVTDGVISLLRVAPIMGRGFTREDDQPDSPDTVVLTYGFWQQKFAGDRQVVGKIIRLDGRPHQVIGVMPANFRVADQELPAVLLPLKLNRNKQFLANFSFHGLARLKAGVTTQQAEADLSQLMPVWLKTFPPNPGFSLELFEKTHFAPVLQPLKKQVVGDIGPLLWVLMGSISVVFLIACGNIANLLLVRAQGRQQELAVRAALGARWRDIAFDLLLESFVLGVAGSLLGLLLAAGALPLVLRMAPHLPRSGEIGMDGTVLLFTLLLAFAAGLLFSALPVMKYGGTHVAGGLRQVGRGYSAGREHQRARNSLVIFQMALASVLLVCSGLMVRTFFALNRVEPGFANPDQLQSFRLVIPRQEIAQPENVVRLQEEVLRNMSAVPGVSAVAATTVLPMDGSALNWNPLMAEDHNYAPGQIAPQRHFKFVTPGFFKAMGTPMIAGRDFTWAEVYGHAPVVVISESHAREYWGGARNALGKRVRVATVDPWREIIGVAGDIHDEAVSKSPETAIYWPIFMEGYLGGKYAARSLLFVARSPRAGTDLLMKDLRQAVWSVDANLPLADVHTEGQYYRSSLARTSFTLIVLMVAGGMALMLGIVGVYGVVAYSVSQRTREIGVRIALGAPRNRLTALFLRTGALLTATGIACGLLASVVVMRLLSSILFGVKPLDPLTYAVSSIGLLAVALLACYLPSRRAAGLDPIRALRAE